ncbi:MAG: hypothetical protein L0Y80_07130 [Ignavibacteriae bacterium]|nr:hypothetical protein [Ignavibacteriota bacterium]
METPKQPSTQPTPALRKRRPKPFSKTDQQHLADYVTTDDIHDALAVLRRQLKRKNARTARYLLEKIFY